MDNTHLNALCIQFIAGDIREYGLDNENGGNLYRGMDGEVYFYCGS